MQKMKQKSDFIGPICPPEYLAPELKIVFLKARVTSFQNKYSELYVESVANRHFECIPAIRSWSYE